MSARNEWLCAHGVGHPPAGVDYINSIHGCDGCCGKAAGSRSVQKQDWIFIGDLSDDAQRAIIRSIDKFRAGAKEHGPLQLAGRTWTRSMLEEAIDFSHYAIFQLLALEDAEKSTGDANGKT